LRLVTSPMFERRGTTTGPPRTFSRAKLILSGRPNNAYNQNHPNQQQLLVITKRIVWKIALEVYDDYKQQLTFPSMASFALLASSSFEKLTNPKPLDLPLSLSYNIFTKKLKKLHDLGTLIDVELKIQDT
jgi:hypothetical protein